ncbi:hypothetical protein [Acinetobacter sp. Marseille-Q1618]|uniref:hypothetical protein n=1 Tax=Acinetobacter sp. Marseille-Q1618 TaxID=2697502 RepID=UPI00156F7D1E|nr:hypothetical protein [Acinetobacter sp. Marseille-Q1618]
MKSKNIVILLFCWVFSSITHAGECVPKKHAKIPNITGKSYHQARKLLIGNQWQPFRTLNINTAKENLGYGNGLTFWNKGYREVENCAGTGMAPCIFNFKDVYGNNLKIYTEGEEDKKYPATVSSYEFNCEYFK